MNKFKIGDRVEIIKDNYSHDPSRLHEKGTVIWVLNYGYYVNLDKPELNRVDNIWYVRPDEITHYEEEKPMKYKIGDHVELIWHGLGLTSKSLKVGDRGEVKDLHKDKYFRSYLVTFNTCNGPRNQWVKEEDLSPVSHTLDSRIKELEKELETLKAKQEEDKWIDITHECSIGANFDVFYEGGMLFSSDTNYKAEGMRIFKRK